MSGATLHIVSILTQTLMRLLIMVKNFCYALTLSSWMTWSFLGSFLGLVHYIRVSFIQVLILGGLNHLSIMAMGPIHMALNIFYRHIFSVLIYSYLFLYLFLLLRRRERFSFSNLNYRWWLDELWRSWLMTCIQSRKRTLERLNVQRTFLACDTPAIRTFLCPV